MTGPGHAHPHGSLPHRHDAGEGPVVLDVGGDVGALVLRTGTDMLGAEIEISPVGEPGRRQHVAVHSRPTATGSSPAAVYPELASGSWQLWTAGDVPAMVVRVDGGRVTEADWEPAQ